MDSSTAPPPSWHALSPDEALLRTASRAGGLRSAEAAERLARDGRNVVARAPPASARSILVRQVESPLLLVLLAAAGVAAVLGRLADAAIVAGVVVVNALIGFLQEFRASRAIEALGGLVPERATAFRDGAPHPVPVEELVVGDVVTLAAGDKVPADLRLLAVKGLRIEEAALTGESVPASKALGVLPEPTPLGDRTCLAFAGTLVTSGTGTGVVVGTGAATELGRISGLLREAAPLETPLTRALAQVGRALTAGVLAVAALLLAVGTWRLASRGVPAGAAARDMLVFAISLAVGAVPEGLPAIVTIALAVGVQRMASRRAIIRKLPAVETLGATSVICSDKTGTLTRNEMTVRALWLPDGELDVEGIGHPGEGRLSRAGRPVSTPEGARELLAASVLCSDATVERRGDGWAVTGDPTEVALVVAARKGGLDPAAVRAGAPRLDVIPFEPEHQFMATLHRDDAGGTRAIVKGAPEVVLARCADVRGAGPVDGAALAAEVARLGGRGLRVLAVAARARPGAEHLAPGDVASGLTLLGLVGMIDPPRAEALAAVRACQAAGIRVKMITGDHPGTAEAIGRELGLLGSGERALSGAALARLDDAALRRAAAATHVFARVAPEHKLRLVRALQHDGQVVAMTGDGVNDAPALQQADIGVAMGITGTSVAKEAADVVLTDDDFATLVAAVAEGRRVYDNLVKSLTFVLPTNVGLALLFACAVAAFPFDEATGALLVPIRPAQLLWVNLVAAVALALPLAFEAPEADLMTRPPRDPRAPLLSRLVLRRTVLAALVMTAGVLLLFLSEWRAALAQGVAAATALAEAQTMATTAVVLFQILYLLESRSLRATIFGVGLQANPTVVAGVAATVLLQAAFVYAPALHALLGSRPLAAADLGRAALVASVIVPVMALEKALTRRSGRRPRLSAPPPA